MSETQRSHPRFSSAPPSVDLLVTPTRLMLRGSGEGSFRISSTVRQVARAYGGSADLQVLPTSPVRLEYEMAPAGRDLERVVRGIAAWSQKWLAGAGPTGARGPLDGYDLEKP